MTSKPYRFTTHWQVEGTAEEMIDLLTQLAEWPRWWPAVHRKATALTPGDENGNGRVATLYSSGWLPYPFRWNSRLIEVNAPHDFTITVWGDFLGKSHWTLEPEKTWVNITHEWQGELSHALLRYLASPLQPLFESNYHWAMRQGERSLRLEMARRRANTQDEISRIPDTPTPPSYKPFILGVIALSSLLFLSSYLIRRNSVKG